MLLIDNCSRKDPAMNLALEEFLVRRFQGAEAALLFYVNEASVVIGRNQIPCVEIDLQEAQSRHIKVVRRMSGGGAVYHDGGNLNFSLIQSRNDRPFPSPTEVLEPVLEVLQAMGLAATLNDRHDIMMDDKKVTGTAQYRTQRTCLTHGTLLISADLEVLQRILASDSNVTFYRGRRSIHSTVANLAHYRSGLTPAELREALLHTFAVHYGELRPTSLLPDDWAVIGEMAQDKYGSWGWTFGHAPEFHLRRVADLPWGRCEAVLRIQRGLIVRIDLRLPAGAPPRLTQLPEALEGHRYRPDSLAAAATSAGWDRFLPGLSNTVSRWLCPSFFGWH